MKGRTFIKLPALAKYSKSKLQDESFEWVSIGVVQGRTPVKTSSNGKKFRILTIGDLKNITLSLFLFGDAFQSHENIPIGTMVIVLNAKVLPAKERSSFALSVFNGGQMVKLGVSKDLAICKGVRKSDGKKCSMAIDARTGKYCEYHVAAQFKRVAAGRMDLAGSSGVLGRGAPKNKKRQNNFFGIQRRNLSEGTYNRFGGAQHGSKGGNLIVGQRGNVLASRPTHGQRFDAQRKKFKANLEQSIEANGMQRMGVGQRNMARMLGIGSNHHLDRKNAVASRQPQLRRPGDLFRGKTTMTAREAYAAKVKAAGVKFQKADPNDSEGLRKELKRTKEQAVRAGIAPKKRGVLGNKRPRGEKEEAERRKRREEILSKKSKHAGLGDDLRKNEMERQLDLLAEKEAMVKKMAEQKEMEVTAYCCVDCGYLLERAHTSCVRDGHACHEIKATKRFFKCTGCGRRESTLGAKIYKKTCMRCKGTSWRLDSLSGVATEAKRKKFDITKDSRASEKSSYLTGRYYADR
jgi:minichromosome maintenance protein 10